MVRTSPIRLSGNANAIAGTVGAEVLEQLREGTLDVTNATAGNVARVIANKKMARGPRKMALFKPWHRYGHGKALFDAHSLGRGAFGDVFRVVVTPEVLAYMERLASVGSFKVVSKLPALGETVAIKEQTFFDSSEYDQGLLKVEFAVREALLHQQLTKRTERVVVPGCSRKPALAIPAFYMSAGIVKPLKSTSSVKRVQVLTVMGHVDGVEVGKGTRNSMTYDPFLPRTAELYVAVERAIVTLWLFGMTHGDFHTGNVLFDPATGKATVIDFAFGVILPEKVRTKLAGAVAAMIERGVKSLADVWEPVSRGGAGLRQYTNSVQAVRGVKKYAPDSRGLKALYNELPLQERARVPEVRRAAWGCGRKRSASPANARAPRRRVNTQ